MLKYLKMIKLNKIVKKYHHARKLIKNGKNNDIVFVSF